MRYVRSFLKLWWVVLAETGRTLAALARGDWTAAGGHARVVAIRLHDDLMALVNAVQGTVPLWPVPGAGIDRILIVKLDRIGDMVNTTPVFDALRARFPGARLDVVGHPASLAVLSGDPRVGERFVFRSSLYHPVRVFHLRWREWLLVFKLLWRRYPLVVYLRGSFPFLLLGATSRVAATKFIIAEPVIVRYFNALEALLGPLPRFAPRLAVDPAAARFADGLLAAGDRRPGPRVVIHAAASTATRVWPPERFAALADQLADRCAANVHFLGGPGERAGLDAIARLARHTHSYHSTLRLPQVAAVIAASDLFIGNDSGLSHIATAVGTRLVVLWGSANLSMSRPAAPPADCTILYQEIPCRDQCLEFRCDNPVPFECLMRTQVADVVDAARRLLEDRALLPAGRSLPVLAPARAAGYRDRLVL
jgi:heptosyltransferase-3